MVIRGLQIPDLDFPPGLSEELRAYVSQCPEERLSEIMSCGLQQPELVRSDRGTFEIFVGLEALRNPEETPSIWLSAMSFAYLLYHHRRLDEAFSLLESLAAFFEVEGRGTPDDPLGACQDPFYVGGLFLSHGQWHGPEALPEARGWFLRAIHRGAGELFRAVLFGAWGLMEHRMGRYRAASRLYRCALRQLEIDISLDAIDGPIFAKELKAQGPLLSEQIRLCEEHREPSIVLTQYGTILQSTGSYDFWCPA